MISHTREKYTGGDNVSLVIASRPFLSSTFSRFYNVLRIVFDIYLTSDFLLTSPTPKNFLCSYKKETPRILSTKVKREVLSLIV